MPFVGDSDVIGVPGSGSSFERIKTQGGNASRRTWLDVLLLGMEILAVVGMTAIVVNGLTMLGILNRNVAAAFQQPTLEPTPIVREVVLPEGHTPPNSPVAASPN